MNKLLVQKVESLIKEDCVNEAKNLLIKEGFESADNDKLQQIYYSLIPESPEFLFEKEHSLKDVFNENIKIRQDSSNYIFKQSLKEYSNTRKAWQGDPRIVNILLSAVTDIDLKVKINITGALWMISNRYLKDVRIYNALLNLVNDKYSDVRYYAALGLSNYSFDNKWDVLISTLEKEKSKKVIDAILKNVYIKSSMGTWGEISVERAKHILEKLNHISNNQLKKEIKEEIETTINWVKYNLL